LEALELDLDTRRMTKKTAGVLYVRRGFSEESNAVDEFRSKADPGAIWLRRKELKYQEQAAVVVERG
jgi:hypothetical protein